MTTGSWLVGTAAIGISALIWVGPVRAADDTETADEPPASEEQSAEGQQKLAQGDLDDLTRVSAYINSIGTMKGRFTQYSETQGEVGKVEGDFFMNRPGRLRFEYDPPNPIVLVADGVLVSVEDKNLETVNSYPLKATPLNLLLKEDVDLVVEAEIVSVVREDGELHVTAREDDSVAEGELTMTFSYPDVELRRWLVIDAQNIKTLVVLSDVVKDVKLDPSLFTTTDYDFEDRD